MSLYESTSGRRRVIGISIVVLVHILVTYVLVSGLARDIAKAVKQTVKVSVLEDPPPPPPPPPPKKPEELESPPPPPPKAYVPPTEAPVAIAAGAAAITSTTAKVAPPPAPPAPAVAKASAVCNKQTSPEYPFEALSDEIQGAVMARFKVNDAGGFESIVAIEFQKIPGKYQNQFKQSVVQALRAYHCNKGLGNTILEKEFAFRLD